MLFAWLHQKRVLEWRDVELGFDWDLVADSVVELGDAVDQLYGESIDRPRAVHWLKAYELVASVVTPAPRVGVGGGVPAGVPAGPPRGYTDLVMDDEFPLSMCFEALNRKMKGVIGSTTGIRATED